MRAERGFSLVETLVALVVFLFGVLLATQLLLETSRRLRDGYARDLETPVQPLRARLRADFEAAVSGHCERDAEGTATAVRAIGHPTGTVVYQLEDGTLWRFLATAPAARLRVLSGVRTFLCADSGPWVGLELRGRRRALRRSPLVGSPRDLTAASEPWVEILWVAPRGGGRGSGW